MSEKSREHKRAAEKLAREKRGILPDDHPLEVARLADVAAQIRDENRLHGRDRRDQSPRETRCKCYAELPDRRGRFG